MQHADPGWSANLYGQQPVITRVEQLFYIIVRNTRNSGAMVSVISGFLLIFGAATAFAGWRLYSAAIVLTGAVFGSGLGWVVGVVVRLLVLGPGWDVGPIPVVFGVVGMFVGMIIAVVAHRLVHALSGFLFGFVIGFYLSNNTAMSVLFGVIGAYLAWALHKLTVIALTAIVGAILITLGLGLEGPSLVGILIIAPLGMAVQFGLFGTEEEGASQLYQGSMLSNIQVPGILDEDGLIDRVGGCPACGEDDALEVNMKWATLSMSHKITCTTCGTKLEFVPPKLFWRTENVYDVVEGDESLVGTRVTEEECRERASEQAEEDDEEVTCPNCEDPCEPGDAYCYGCGAGLRWCGACGRVGLTEWAYCNNCGDTLESE